MKQINFILLLLLPFLAVAQFPDTFSDGDFTNNPAWSGNTDNFIVNGSGQLQLNDADASHTISYLSTPASTQGMTTWEFYTMLDFATSGSNYARFYLSSDNSDLSAGLNGYYVQVGGTSGSTDALTLKRQTNTSSSTLITGTAGAVGGDPVLARVQVTRDDAGNWELLADYTGGTAFNSEGTANDNTHPMGTYLGVYCRYTSSRSDLIFFDDINADPLFTDTTAPNLLTASIESATEVTLTFDEPMDAASVAALANYSIDNGVSIVNAVIDSSDPTIVHLTISPAMANGQSYTISVSGMTDIAGNPVVANSKTLSFFMADVPNPYDILITEIMPDPSPVVGLPNAEFVELYNNTTDKAFDLAGFEFSSGGPQTLSSFILAPGAYVIICDDNFQADFSVFGDVIAVNSFPSLTNTGDFVRLTDPNGVIIDEVNYTDDWYQGSTKDGYTLELINPSLYCQDGQNWRTSINTNGGTPGAQNSVFDDTPDTTGPSLIEAIVVSENEVRLFFNEILDDNVANVSNFNTSTGTITDATLETPDKNTILLTYSSSFVDATTYTVTVLSAVTDCIGNSIGSNNTATFTYYETEPPSVDDIIINEIMIDPIPVIGLPNAEYVELFNNSNKTFNLEGYTLKIGNSAKTLTPFILQPDSFVIICKDENIPLFAQYGDVIGITSSFSLSNTSTTLTLSDNFDNVVNVLTYSSEWYRNSDRDEGGYSLELINPEAFCRLGENWRASEDSKGGTPGSINSVYSTEEDMIRPTLVEVIPLSNNQVRLFFNETMDAGSITAANFTSSLGTITNATLESPANTTALLTFMDSFTDLANYSITALDGVTDCTGNSMLDSANDADFIYYVTDPVEPNDIIINEFLADKSPQRGLPDAEFIELYNRTDKVLNLYNMEITSSSSTTSKIQKIPYYILQPKEYVILCDEEIELEYLNYGNALGIEDFPSINDSKGALSLTDSIGVVLNYIGYDKDMYQDEEKENGGWSFELVDPDYMGVCAGSPYWSASLDLNGGTPGRVNSNGDLASVISPPQLINVFPQSKTELLVTFSQSIAPSFLTDKNNYSIDNGVVIANIQVASIVLNEVRLILSAPLSTATVYTLTITDNSLEDCFGNVMEAGNSLAFGIPEGADEGELLINEIMFDPTSGATEYIEFYNPTEKIFNLNDFSITRANKDGDLSSKNIGVDYLMLPNSYAIVTKDKQDIIERYEAATARLIVESSINALDNDAGSIALIYNGSNITIDFTNYADDYHSDLIVNPKGISLERISFNAPSDDPNNWHSAASQVGFGTPTYQNSQYFENPIDGAETVSLAKKTFSPDGDSNDDFLLINYSIGQSGYTADIKIFDARGRLIKELVNNENLANEGTYQWDGSTDDGIKARLGIYVIFVELFDAEGNVERFKETCVLAGQLK